MSDLIRKTFTLGSGLVEKISDTVDQAAENDLNLSESAVVRLALTQGLPLVLQNLGISKESSNESPNVALV